MAGSGSERRQRNVKQTVRFTTEEHALASTIAGVAGLSLASHMRTAALNFRPARSGRVPSLNQQLAVQLLAEMGRLSTAFDAAVAADGRLDDAAVETAMRDQSEMRLILFETLGIAP